jgi:hypothetical protein
MAAPPSDRSPARPATPVMAVAAIAEGFERRRRARRSAALRRVLPRSSSKPHLLTALSVTSPAVTRCLAPSAVVEQQGAGAVQAARDAGAAWSPASSMLTRSRPRRASRCRQPARTASPSPAGARSRQPAMAVIERRREGCCDRAGDGAGADARSAGGSPPAAAISGRVPSAPSRTFSPSPTATVAGPCDFAAQLDQDAAELGFPPSSRSLGHLRPMPVHARGPRARVAQATPTAAGSEA